MQKYFTELLGNAESRERLGKAITEGTLPHAFLIGGPEGSGKRTFAKMICAAANCAGGESLPCMRCNSCRRIMEESFVDLKFFARQKDRATIGVDDMRLLKEDAMLSGGESEKKFYIIEDAHCLTVESQNALLNILEEPPSGVTIMLLATECDRILTTIKSRVQYIAMTRFSDEETLEYAIKNIPEAREMRSFNTEGFRALIKNAEGVIGKVQDLFKRGVADKNREERERILAIIGALAPKVGFTALHSAIGSLPNKRPELMLTLEGAIGAVRDLIILKQSRDAKLIFFVSEDEAAEYARGLSTARLMSAYDALIVSHEYCSKNANVGTVLANLESKINLV